MDKPLTGLNTNTVCRKSSLMEICHVSQLFLESGILMTSDQRVQFEPWTPSWIFQAKTKLEFIPKSLFWWGIIPWKTLLLMFFLDRWWNILFHSSCQSGWLLETANLVLYYSTDRSSKKATSPDFIPKCRFLEGKIGPLISRKSRWNIIVWPWNSSNYQTMVFVHLLWRLHHQ